MKEIGVLMKPNLAQAAHDGDKTKTRRVIENQDLTGAPKGGFNAYELEDGKFGFANDDDIWVCPYGKPGDLLWVKEVHYAFGGWFMEGYTKKGNEKSRFYQLTNDDYPVLFPNNKPENVIQYRDRFYGDNKNKRRDGYYKRNSLFMPKIHCRTWLKITNIRVERLLDISKKDCVKEGVPAGHGMKRSMFKFIWDNINNALGFGWDTNPWVWVIEFERIER